MMKTKKERGTMKIPQQKTRVSKKEKTMKRRATQLGAKIIHNATRQRNFCCRGCWQQLQGEHLNQGRVGIFVNPCKKGTFPTKYLSSICNPTNVCLQELSNAKGPITGCNMVQKEIKLWLWTVEKSNTWRKKEHRGYRVASVWAT